MSPTEKVLSKLPDAKRSGNGWAARCPAHGDRKASLSVAEASNGAALLKCHAGCDNAAIVKAMGLGLRDLSSNTDTKPVIGNGKHRPSGKTFPTAEAAVVELERRHGKPSATWTYHDAEGEPVGLVVRWDTADGKDIRPVARHADGWRIGAMPEPRHLYKLPELADAELVVVVEGEKCAEAARSLGFVATTNAGGAQAAGKTDWRPLAGKEVWALPDNDKPGRKRNEWVASTLTPLGCTVKIIDLPGLPDGGDVVDWIDAHGDAAEPDSMREEIEAMAKATPIWRPEAKREPGPVLRCLADVEPRPVSWLWHGRVPLGRITLLVGRPGEGKSFLTTDIAARVSTGTPWPDRSPCPKGSVIMICAEDDPGDTIRPRLDAHTADVQRIHLLSAVNRDGGGVITEKVITLADIDAIEEALKRVQDCRLIVVDPIGSYLGCQTDSHRDNEVRGVLAPIAALAEKYGPAVLVVAHRRKSSGSNADDLALGSRAFTGIARAVWHLTRDTENKARRLMLPGKNNLAVEGEGLAFSIIGNPPHVAWERDPVAMSADDALAAEGQSRDQKRGPGAEEFNKAVGWLQYALAEGPRLADELLEEWRNGQSGSKRTLDRAKQSLPVEAYRPKVPGPWWWQLTSNIAKRSKGEELGNLGNLAKSKGKTAILKPHGSKDAK